jgi:phytoene dehydrogenase-like protein
MAKRALVIGAGHNGLVAAYNLRRRGFDVEVLEASNRVGGMTDTSEISGVRVSRASYVLGLMPSTLIEDFGVPVIQQDPPEVIFFEGKPIPLWRDPLRRRKEFEVAGVDRYSEFEECLLKFKEVLGRFTFVTTPPSRDQVLEDAEKLGVEHFLLKSCESLLSDFLPRELHPSFYYPSMRTSPAYLVAYFFAEWSVVRGGMGAVAQSVLSRARHLGVQVRLNTRVEKIVTRGGRVFGVEAGGKRFDAQVVLSTASPIVTAALTEDLKLDCHVQESSWTKYNVVLKRYPAMPDVIKSYASALLDLEPMGVGEILFPSLVDQTLGGAVLNVMGQLEALYDLLPDLEDCVKAVDKVTPKVAEDIYNVPGGNVNHIPMAEPYLFNNRPQRGVGYRTPITGLYLGGAGTYPGGQVTGVPGYNSSNAVIEDYERDAL